MGPDEDILELLAGHIIKYCEVAPSLQIIAFRFVPHRAVNTSNRLRHSHKRITVLTKLRPARKLRKLAIELHRVIPVTRIRGRCNAAPDDIWVGSRPTTAHKSKNGYQDHDRHKTGPVRLTHDA